jgi:hypothetical protein
LTSFLLRTLPTPPINPRDHSLLENIYAQMLASRFINSSPLAILANSLGVYFKGIMKLNCLQQFIDRPICRCPDPPTLTARFPSQTHEASPSHRRRILFRYR